MFNTTTKGSHSMIIIKNSIKCNDIIESFKVHDYKRCICGAVSVDVDSEYLLR